MKELINDICVIEQIIINPGLELLRVNIIYQKVLLIRQSRDTRISYIPNFVKKLGDRKCMRRNIFIVINV